MHWVERWGESLQRGVDALADMIPDYGDQLSLPHIGAVCALDYLDLRATDQVNWREKQPLLKDWYQNFGERPAMVETRPQA